MATKNIPYYTVTVYTIGGGDFELADTDASRAGKDAWTALQNQADICVDTEMNDTPVTLFIPFHAVDHAVKAVTTTEVTRPDSPCPVEEDAGEP